MSGLTENMSIDQSAAHQPAHQPNPMTSAPTARYRCGDCGYENELKLQDPIRCRTCGFRVLYKIRTNRMIQFEAR